MFLSRFCTCIRSYLQSELSVFQDLFQHIQPVVVVDVAVTYVYIQFERSSIGVSLCSTCACSVTHKWLNWFHECPSFSPEWVCWKDDFAHKKQLQQISFDMNSFPILQRINLGIYFLIWWEQVLNKNKMLTSKSWRL